MLEFDKLKLDYTNELNVSHFKVLRSYDGKSFDDIGSVEAFNIEDQANEYSFINNDPGIGLIYYQLEQFDFDGNSEKSSIIFVGYKSEERVLNMSLIPNPAQADELNIHFYGNSRAPYQFKLIDVPGKEIWSNNFQIDSGSLVQQIRLSEYVSMQPGIYIVTLYQGGERVRKRIVIK